MDVRQRAVYYLNMSPKTEAQLRAYLKKKGYGDDETNETIEEMKEYHYIDDFRFSMQYFEYGFEKGRGIARIKRELKEKGVASDIIDMAYEELEDVPDQFETALAIAEAMTEATDMSELDYEEKRKLHAKIGRRLAGRGFTSDIVYKVIGRFK